MVPPPSMGRRAGRWQVEAGPAERTTLLEMRDTGARLAWVLEAVEPHLATLRAKYALMRAYE